MPTRATRPSSPRSIASASAPEFEPGVRRLGGDQAADESARPAVAVRDAGVQARGQTRRADRLEATAATFSQRAGDYIQRADNYALASVLFAASLFFAGISTRLHARAPRSVVLGLGYALFLGTVVWILTSPGTSRLRASNSACVITPSSS